MDIQDYKSGSYKQQYQYRSFTPTFIHHEWQLSDSSLNFLLSQADIKLGELNAFPQLIPNVDFFILMHVMKEATMSSRIEGTETNIEEALQKKENIEPEKRNDWEEVQNYNKAMREAIGELKSLPVSGRLLKTAHKILLQGVRGKDKKPGEFRESQNWIGGASINDAIFIPPHYQDISELMTDLEKFLNDEIYPVPDLIRIAIAHYQFETIHPFLDGNGRIGRLLITLYLVEKKLLVKPTLYLSAFFEKNKDLYYDNLTRVRTHNDLTQWIKFFLEGVRQTAENSIQTFRNIIILTKKLDDEVITLGRRAKNAQLLLQYLYSEPIVNGQQIAEKLSIDLSTSFRLIDDFVKLGILHEMKGYKRNRVFIFEEYVKLFE